MCESSGAWADDPLLMCSLSSRDSTHRAQTPKHPQNNVRSQDQPEFGGVSCIKNGTRGSWALISYPIPGNNARQCNYLTRHRTFSYSGTSIPKTTQVWSRVALEHRYRFSETLFRGIKYNELFTANPIRHRLSSMTEKKSCKRCKKPITEKTPALSRYYVLCSVKCYDCWYGDKRPEKTYQKIITIKEQRMALHEAQPGLVLEVPGE